MATTFKLFSDKMGGRDATAYIGTPGEMFYDSTTGGLRVSDGTTVGGKPIELSTVSLTGNVDANVNLRSGALSDLLNLAGGTSEIGYATDSNSLVRFNGTAGGAQILGGYGNGGTLNFTLNQSNIAALTNPASGVYIDCNNVSYLIIKIDPALVAAAAISSPYYTNLNIKLPNSSSIPVFKMYLPYIGISTELWSYGGVKFNLAYQTSDLCQVYRQMPFDMPVSTDVAPYKPKIQFFTSMNSEITFVANFDVGDNRWTRLPLPGEGGYNNTSQQVGFPNSSSQVGGVITMTGTAVTLASGVVSSSLAYQLPAGLWLMSAWAVVQVADDLVASDIMVGVERSAAVSPPSTATTYARTTLKNPSAGSITLTLPSYVKTSAAAIINFYNYGNVRATFTGTAPIVTVYQTAVRIA